MAALRGLRCGWQNVRVAQREESEAATLKMGSHYVVGATKRNFTKIIQIFLSQHMECQTEQNTPFGLR